MTDPAIPAGLHVELSRHLVRPGQTPEADRWMQTLRDRREECVATLARDGMAIEVIFRAREGDDDVLYWFEIGSRSGNLEAVPEDELTPIDRVAASFSARAKVRGHTDLDVELVLMPEPIERAIRGWLADSP